MLKIRFMRAGRKKQPFYKIVVTDKNNPPKSGRFKEMVGFYNPLTKECKIEKDKVLAWIEKGAQPTDVVRNLFIKKEVIRGKKISVVSLTKKRLEKVESKKKAEEKLIKEKEETKIKAEQAEKEAKEAEKEVQENAEEKIQEEPIKEEVEEDSAEEKTEEKEVVVEEESKEEEKKEEDK